MDKMKIVVQICLTVFACVLAALLAYLTYRVDIRDIWKLVLYLAVLVGLVIWLVWIWVLNRAEKYAFHDESDKGDKEAYHSKNDKNDKDKTDKGDKEVYHSKNDKNDKDKTDKSGTEGKNDKVKSGSALVLDWNNADAAQYLGEASRDFGPPSFIDVTPDGMAVWKESDLTDTCFIRHELRDESVVHRKPKPHRDFFYSYVDYEVPLNKFDDVQRLSGSVGYDPLKKQLYARCGNIGANIASLALATEIAKGDVSIQDVHNNQIYKQWIEGSQSNLTDNPQYNILCQNINSQVRSLPDDCFPLAFPDC